MKYTAYLLFAISGVMSSNFSLASRSIDNIESSHPECFLCHESSFQEHEFITLWEHAFPQCLGGHTRGYVCSLCSRRLSHLCPLCLLQETAEIPTASLQELLVNHMTYRDRRLARFNQQGRDRQGDFRGDQEEISR